MKLQITTTDGRTIDVTEQNGESVIAAFRAWQAAPERSSAEHRAWDEVLEAADDYLEDIGRDDEDETAHDVNVPEHDAPHRVDREPYALSDNGHCDLCNAPPHGKHDPACPYLR